MVVGLLKEGVVTICKGILKSLILLFLFYWHIIYWNMKMFDVDSQIVKVKMSYVIFAQD